MPADHASTSAIWQHEQLLHLLLEQIRDHAVMEVDASGRLLGWNRTIARVFGYSQADMSGADMSQLMPADQRQPDFIPSLLASVGNAGRVEQSLTLQRRNGQKFQGHCVIVPITGKAEFAVIVRDLSVLLASQDQLHNIATADQMTGLANREHMFNLGRVEYRRWRRYRVPLSLLVVEADGFQGLTLQHGAEVADSLLRDVADILKQSVRDVDLVARIEGGLFACLLPSTPQEGAAVLAERIRLSVHKTEFHLGDQVSRHSASLAVLTANDAAPDFDTFLQQARAALEKIQMQGGDRILIA